MSDHTVIRLKSGSVYSLRGDPGTIAERVNSERGGGRLVGFQNDRASGQIFIDPDEVASVQAEQ